MEYKFRPLEKQDLKSASDMDKLWYGIHGISENGLEKFISKFPGNNIAIFKANKLLGFATFEIIESGMPKDYSGNINFNGKVLFMQQFTTITNYKKSDWLIDEKLIEIVETKAKELECIELWEALSITHPYSKENNNDFDAFGFYISHGFTYDKTQTIDWQPDTSVSIPCYLFRKVI